MSPIELSWTAKNIEFQCSFQFEFNEGKKRSEKVSKNAKLREGERFTLLFFISSNGKMQKCKIERRGEVAFTERCNL